MAENWIRYFRLTVARDRTNTQALDFSSYHVTFEISQATVAQPCTARIRIYNVSDATLAQIKGLGQRVGILLAQRVKMKTFYAVRKPVRKAARCNSQS